MSEFVTCVFAGAHLLRDRLAVTAVADQLHEQPGTSDQIVRGIGEHVVVAVLTRGESESHVLLLKCGNSPERMLRLTARKANLRPPVTCRNPSPTNTISLVWPATGPGFGLPRT